MTRKAQATATDVRAFARAAGTYSGDFLNDNTRGRLPKNVVADFEKETGQKYVPGLSVPKTVTLTVTKVNVKGHKRTRKVEKSIAEVRALAGEAAGLRGVLSSAAIEAAEAALSSE